MAARILKDRYELGQMLGRGGMGVVFQAYDTLMKRDVALKTVLDAGNQISLDLFYKEWGLLASIVHPNIVEIYDIGDFEQDGNRFPFFVMPLLRGQPLDKLIREGSPRLTVARLIDIVAQAGRGLQAAHDLGLVHRDIKPSNLFVMDDDSVKIIDFGIARNTTDSKTSLKGTLSYISPEQIQLKPPSSLSDQYALGIVTYEALTRRLPFRGGSDSDVMDAILNQTPPPVTELNPNVNYAISQVVHKALAKQPWHRFANVREYAESLLKAVRGETLQQFDSEKVKPRLQRAVAQFEEGDYEFALELLSELEGEGHLDPEIQLTKRQVDQAVRKTRIRALLENARRFLEAQEYSLALRKIQDALQLDPGDADALALKNSIEKERRGKQIGEWLRLGQQHLDNQSFDQAQDAIDNVLKLKADDTGALQLANELKLRQQAVDRLRSEKSELYTAAMQNWERGNVTAALSKLELLGSIEKEHPDPDKSRASGYQSFYNQVRSEHDQQKNRLEEARRLLSDGNFDQALAICRQSLSKYPNHALFQALQYDVEERRRQKLSSAIAETDRRAEAEPDLDRRVALLDAAVKQYPGEPHFEHALRLARDKRDLVNSIIDKARYFEEQQQFNEALDQWQILKSIHESYPGLDFEIERLTKRRDQDVREKSKARWVEQIDQLLESGDWVRAVRATHDALAEFPGDAEFVELEKFAGRQAERGEQANKLLAKARELTDNDNPAEGIDRLREAIQLDPKHSVIRTLLANALLLRSRNLLDTDLSTAESALRELLELEPDHAAAKSLSAQLADRKREGFVTSSLTQARRLQADGDIEGALSAAKKGLEAFPNETRLLQVQGSLERSRTEAHQPPSGITRVPEPAKEANAEPLAGASTDASILLPPPPAAISNILPPAAESPTPAAKPLPVKKAEPAAVPAPPVAVQPKRNKWMLPAAAAIVILGAGLFFLRPTKSVTPEPAAPTPQPVQPAAPAPEPTPTPAPAPSFTIALASDLNNATVALDGGQPAAVNNVANVPVAGDGTHTLQFKQGDKTIDIAFRVMSGEMPAITTIASSNGGDPVRTIAVASLGATARVYASEGGGLAALDGKRSGSITANGLELNALAPGDHKVEVAFSPLRVANMSFQTGANAALSLFVSGDPNVGRLYVVAGADDAQVFVDGVAQKQHTKKGGLQLYLAPKQYKIRVQAPGLPPVTEKVADVRRGEETRVEFELPSLDASLVIRRITPFSQVLVDGKPAGTVKPDGTFTMTGIHPGSHQIAVQRDQNQVVRYTRVFGSGKTEEMDGNVVIQGTLRIDVKPAGIPVTLELRRSGDPATFPITDRTLALPDGEYTVLAHAQGYPDSIVLARVPKDGSVTATLNLVKPSDLKAPAPSLVKPSEVKPPAPKESKPTSAVIFQLTDWLMAGGWQQQGTSLVRQGGDVVLMPSQMVKGSLQFRASLQKGRRIEWVTDYRDERNYVLFQLEKLKIIRSEYVNGKKVVSEEVGHSLNPGTGVDVLLNISDTEVNMSIGTSGTLNLVSRYSRDAQHPSGRFGFRVPGRDQITLESFRYISR